MYSDTRRSWPLAQTYYPLMRYPLPKGSTRPSPAEGREVGEPVYEAPTALGQDHEQVGIAVAGVLTSRP